MGWEALVREMRKEVRAFRRVGRCTARIQAREAPPCRFGEGLLEFLLQAAGELLGCRVPDSGVNVAFCLALAG